MPEEQFETINKLPTIRYQRASPAPAGFKQCTKCRVTKPLEEFPPQSKTKSGRNSWCRECHRVKAKADLDGPRGEGIKKRSRDWQKANPERMAEIKRRTHLKQLYGITVEEFERRLESQGGKCAICDEVLRDGKHGASVDHDHINGQVRGILCNSCNLVLGKVHDSIEILQSAINYLSRFAPSDHEPH